MVRYRTEVFIPPDRLIGIQLPDSDTGRQLKKKIEGILAPVMQSGRATHTI